MWCLYVSYEGLCGAFISVIRGCILPLYQLRRVVCCLYIGNEGLCGAFNSVHTFYLRARVCVFV